MVVLAQNPEGGKVWIFSYSSVALGCFLHLVLHSVLKCYSVSSSNSPWCVDSPVCVHVFSQVVPVTQTVVVQVQKPEMAPLAEKLDKQPIVYML